MPYTSTTLAALRAQLVARWEGKPFWDAEEARLALNEALSLFNLLTARWRTRASLVTVADQILYTAPAALLSRMRITWQGMPLRPSSREELHLTRPRWRVERTTSGGDVPTRPIVFAPVDLHRFYLWPADPVAGHALVIDGVADTPVLLLDTDTVDLGEELHDVLLNMALHVAAFKKGGSYFELTLPHYQAFLQAAAAENGSIKSMGAYRRAMGSDRRELKPLHGARTDLDQLAQQESA